MSSALAYDAMNESYLGVEKLIYHTVHKFVKRYGGDFEELMSHANEIYIRAYKTYDRNHGKFSSWVRQIIWFQLLERLRRDSMRNARLKRVPMELKDVTDRKHEEFNLEDYTEQLGLSEDAKMIVKLVVDSPKDVLHAVRERGKETPRNVQAGVREFLKDIGWTSRRVTESFSEIRQALR